MNQTLRVPWRCRTSVGSFKLLQKISVPSAEPAARRNKRFVALAVEACNLPLVTPAVRSAGCDRVPHSSRSHALAVVRFPAGGTKGTSGALDRTRLRLKWVRPKALRNWNATHSGSDCNVTCNVEHIQRYTLRYSENLRFPRSATGAPRSATSGALRNWNATHSGSE